MFLHLLLRSFNSILHGRKSKFLSLFMNEFTAILVFSLWSIITQSDCGCGQFLIFSSQSISFLLWAFDATKYKNKPFVFLSFSLHPEPITQIKIRLVYQRVQSRKGINCLLLIGNEWSNSSNCPSGALAVPHCVLFPLYPAVWPPFFRFSFWCSAFFRSNPYFFLGAAHLFIFNNMSTQVQPNRSSQRRFLFYYVVHINTIVHQKCFFCLHLCISD